MIHPIPIVDKLNANLIEDKNGCFIWQGLPNQAGYGRICFNGESYLVHRVAWEIENNQSLGNKLCLHKCDNPPCCNPKHLFVGTHSDNSKDMSVKGRSTSKFTADEVYTIRKLWSEGKLLREIGEEYGVTPQCISLIVNKINYKHI